MLFGINPLVSPELLKVLDEMGHGDEIVLADSNYPAQSNNKRVVRADGIRIVDLLPAILKLIPLDNYSSGNNFILMSTNDGTIPQIWQKYKHIATESGIGFSNIVTITREDFYARSKTAFAVVATGETETYANIIIKKGVINS